MSGHNIRQADIADSAVLQDDDKALKAVAARYAVSVTDAVRETIKTSNDPVALQYMPQARELITTPDELVDPIGDGAHSPVEGIVHRYPDRALLLPVKVCAVYCRFCFRREVVGPGQKMLSEAQLEKALDYIRNTPQIWEVILTGGDPLVLSPRRLKNILDALQSIPHVKVIRIHTRVPVADHKRMTDEMMETLTTDKPLYIAIHTNHAQELSDAALATFKKLRRTGAILLSQTVLLKGVNDTPQALEDLFRRLVENGVKPYYLHHPDLAPGTSHFRLTLKEGRKIFRALRGKLSGLAHPEYVLDIPGGYGKVPVSESFTQEDENDEVTHVTDYQDRTHAYPPREDSK